MEVNEKNICIKLFYFSGFVCVSGLHFLLSHSGEKWENAKEIKVTLYSLVAETPPSLIFTNKNNSLWKFQGIFTFRG